MCSDAARNRLLPVLKKLNLPCNIDCDTQKIIETMSHDKKMSGDMISIVRVEEIGSFNITKINCKGMSTLTEKQIL